MSNELAKLNSVIKGVPLAKMRVSERAQRRLVPQHVSKLRATFDPELLGYPVVNLRDGYYYEVDGQHRVEVVKDWLGDGWKTQSIDCRVYTGMTEAQEAVMFLELNATRGVTAYDRFNTAVTGGLDDEVNVKRTVEGCGLNIARNQAEGTVSCVKTLLGVYRRDGAKTLARALVIVNKSFGDPGLTQEIIDGVALVCQRYNGALQDSDAIARFHDMRGGVGALMHKANVIREQTAQSRPQCVASAAVEILNRGRSKKIPAWFKV